LKLFSVSVISDSYLAGRVLIVAARYDSVVVSIVTATCLLKVKFTS